MHIFLIMNFTKLKQEHSQEFRICAQILSAGEKLLVKSVNICKLFGEKINNGVFRKNYSNTFNVCCVFQ